MNPHPMMALPVWLEWTASIAQIVGGLATAGGVVVAARELSAWRVQRKHDARTAAAARIAEALLRAAASMEMLRFQVELDAEGFAVAVENERNPDRILLRNVQTAESIKQHSLQSTASRDLSIARADAAIYLPEACEIVTQGERLFAVLHLYVHELANALDGDAPSDGFREALARVTGQLGQLRDFRTAVASHLGPLARHEEVGLKRA